MGSGPAPRPALLLLLLALVVLLPPLPAAGERRRLACSTCRGIVDRFNQVRGGGGAEVGFQPRGGFGVLMGREGLVVWGVG